MNTLEELEFEFRQQYKLFHDYVLKNSQSGEVELEYIEPYGNSCGVYIKIDKFVMELVFKPMDDPHKNEIRTRFYLDVEGLYKPFMLRKDAILSEYDVIQRKRKDYYLMSVEWHNWGNLIINTIKTVVNNPYRFLQMCQLSCPFNKDGSHKYKFWKTKATVTVSLNANTGIIQGVKNGETPSGTHIVGSNGSFRFFGKGDYVLNIELDCLSYEIPIKQKCIINIDSFMRQLKEEKGWGRNVPYGKVNSALIGKVAVITYDMDKDPTERSFSPIEYDGNWMFFLNEKLENI